MTRRRAVALLAAGPAGADVRLLFGGDVLLARGVAAASLAHNDYAWPFRAIAPLLAGGDITFINLESPFSETPRPVRADMVFRARREMIAGLTTAGIDVVSTANNHARDAGPNGLEFTLRVLREQGIAAVGTGLSFAEAHAGVVLERKGTRFGFLAYTYDANNGNYTDADPRIAVTDVNQMRSDIASLRRRADVVIVSMHAGWEYHRMPNPMQTAFARAAIDAGASVVAGHHPHVPQPQERYRSGVIFYSLGNLVFDQATPPETKKGLLAEVIFRGAALLEAKTIQVEIVGTSPRQSPPGS